MESTAVELVLGWVLSGPYETNVRQTSTNFQNFHLLKRATEPSLDTKLELKLKQFWEYEALNTNTNTKSPDFNLKKFESQITFNGDKYKVRLPWKMFHEPLSDNFRNCKQRLSSLFNKLKKQPEKLKAYDGIISENIIELAEKIPVPGKCYYLPHHPVYKKSGTSTKTRIVYDASSKRKGPYPNDCLESGPNLLPQLLEIILRFRSNKFGSISDIKQVFLNASIQQSDRDLLPFLRLKAIQNKPSSITLRFTRAIIGITSSRFLLTSVIRKHLETYKNCMSQFDVSFLKNLYADDKEIEVLNFYENASKVMLETGFELRK